MANIVTFDDAPPPGTINLSIGQPSAELLPLELLQQASKAFFASAQSIELNYGVRQGDSRFLNILAKFLSQHYDAPVDAESLFVSGGNSQALDLVTRVFTQPGDTIFVEEPSYFLAFQIFRDHGLNIVSIPVDQSGICIEKLNDALKTHAPKLLYTIPSYHNPGGHCLSLERRKAIIDLSVKHNFQIVADEVYQLLAYYDAPPQAMGTMLDSQTVISLGSFSKILAPALRLGWIQTAPTLMAQLMDSGLSNSGGCINHYGAHIARLFIEEGLQDQHIDTVRNTLRARLEAMDETLQTHFGDIARWTKPGGGYFFWLEFDKHIDTMPLKKQAGLKQTGFQPGATFSSCNGLKNCLRLSFSHYDEDDIVEGIKRIRPLFE